MPERNEEIEAGAAAPAAHDPGGRVRIRLPDGIVGEALITPCGRYRPWMTRDWTPAGADPRAILWVGMNPSTADALVSDPTCTRELNYSRDWGYTRYLKGNMLDWRATDPKTLPADPVMARSAQNLPAILEMAAEAETTILGYGILRPAFQPIVQETIAALRALGRPLMCLGQNADGSARHPLYLRKDLLPQPFLG